MTRRARVLRQLDTVMMNPLVTGRLRERIAGLWIGIDAAGGDELTTQQTERLKEIFDALTALADDVKALACQIEEVLVA